MRKDWVNSLCQLARPVLQDFAQQRHTMPRENAPEGRDVCYLEALGRTLCGLAPWLEAALPPGPEQLIQTEFRNLARCALANAVDPESPVFIRFDEDAQNIVDAAFLAQGLLRAPRQLLDTLTDQTRQQLIEAMKRQRAGKPYYNNWLCFSAMIELFLQRMGERDWDPMRVDCAIRAHDSWYKGDGFYGDGNSFAFNYYNSFVIQPMLVDLVTLDRSGQWEEFKKPVLDRARLCASHLEELIMPDGRFPVLGRSSCYRYGAFHLLAQSVLRQDCAKEPGSIRGALEAVIGQIEVPGMFDSDGWLTIGVHGHQPQRGDSYINTGSCYLCSTVFLPLGLPPEAPFWSEPEKPWTQREIWGL